MIQASLEAPERFAEIYDAYFVEIHKYVERRLGQDIADDLAAETFVAAFRQRQRYDRTRGDARAWLYGIATNLIRRHRRREVAMYKALARAGAAEAVEVREDGLDARIIALGLRPQLLQALARLNPGDRDVVLMVTLAELSYEQVAEALDIPYGTVCSRLNRARRKLREALGPSDPFEEE
ncbi:RNA polymerase sigma factor [Actinoallomurus vinaceus]|uniref:RNA polymerase sigma factor n=1 Tax=Actinoallomurus vinaceus TaxID=1080074 RepID=UPI0031E9E357